MRKITVANCFDCPLCTYVAETEFSYAFYKCVRSGKDVSKCRRDHKLYNECPLEEDTQNRNKNAGAPELNVHNTNN